MSEFSELLSQYIHNKNIKTYPLAHYCGLDRSNMYKIIKGQRKPTSIEMVSNMCRFMQLSPNETKEMQEAYMITLIGPENYYRRKNTKLFFEEFRLPSLSFPATIYKTEVIPKTDDTFLLNTQTEINNALLRILSLEFSREKGHIRMLIQPDYSFLVDLLVSEGIGKSNILIDHIICLDNNTDFSQGKNDYNLNCLKRILPLYGSIHNYETFYYYDNIASKNDSFTLFPYIIITSEYACLLTSDIRKGYITSTSESLEMLCGIFDDYLTKSSRLLKRIDSLFDQLDYVQNLVHANMPAYSFQMTPCLTFFMDAHFVDKYVIQELPNRTAFIERFVDYVNNMIQFRNTSSMCSIFSLEGLIRFMETGEIGEYPSNAYNRPLMEDRINLARQLLQACRTNNYRMLKNNIGSLDNELFLFISQTRGYLMLNSPVTHSLIYLDIEEPGLLFTFFDFCENMDDRLFFTKEEMIAQLKAIIEKYQELL